MLAVCQVLGGGDQSTNAQWQARRCDHAVDVVRRGKLPADGSTELPAVYTESAFEFRLQAVHYASLFHACSLLECRGDESANPGQLTLNTGDRYMFRVQQPAIRGRRSSPPPAAPVLGGPPQPVAQSNGAHPLPSPNGAIGYVDLERLPSVRDATMPPGWFPGKAVPLQQVLRARRAQMELGLDGRSGYGDSLRADDSLREDSKTGSVLAPAGLCNSIVLNDRVSDEDIIQPRSVWAYSESKVSSLRRGSTAYWRGHTAGSSPPSMRPSSPGKPPSPSAVRMDASSHSHGTPPHHMRPNEVARTPSSHSQMKATSTTTTRRKRQVSGMYDADEPTAVRDSDDPNEQASLCEYINAVLLLRPSKRALRRLADANMFDVVGGVSAAEMETLAALPAEDRSYVVMNWILRLMAQRMRQGGLAIPPPLLSRTYQILSDAMLGAQQAVKVRSLTPAHDQTVKRCGPSSPQMLTSARSVSPSSQLATTPFPYPLRQLLALLLLAFQVFVPMAVAAFVDSPPLVASLCFFICLGYMALNEAARELEHPFGLGANHLPVVAYQEAFNSKVARLLEVSS